MKRFTQCACLILVFAMAFAVPTSAMEIGNQKASNYFAAYSAYFDHDSGNQYDICFSVTALDEMDELGAKTITLKRSTDQNNWTTVGTYNMSNYSQMVNKNGTFTHAASVDCTCTPGYYYVAFVELYAKDGNSTATKTVWTTTLDLT